MILNATNIGKKLGGIGVYTLQLAKYILDNNIECKIYINQNATEHFSDIQKPKLNILSSSISPDYGFKGHLRRLFQTQKFNDELLFNTSQLEVNFFNKNQYITVHDLIPLHFPKLHKRQYHFFKYVLPFVLKRVKKIITVSYNTKKELMKYYNLPEDKIIVIHNGVDIVKPIISEKDNTILFVGRPSYAKNITRMIESFILAKDKYNIKENLKIVGFTKDELELPNHKDIIYCGYVSDNELELLYRTSKVLFFPSLYEGFGYPILEAMKYGTPVITSNCSSMPEVGQDAVVYIDPYDMENMAFTLNDMLSNSKLQDNMIQKGFERVKDFKLEHSLKQYKDLLDDTYTKMGKKVQDIQF